MNSQQELLFREINTKLQKELSEKAAELEAKNRELEIEAALEKVRSASLAMQNSGQIREIVKVVFEKLKELKFAIDGGVFVGTMSNNSDYVNFWIGDDHAEYPGSFKIPNYDAPTITDVWNARKTGAEFISKTYSFQEKNIWFEYAFNHTDLKNAHPEDFKKWILEQEYLTQSFAMQKNSMIGVHFHHSKTLTENEIDILKRFSRVFEQSYVRFLDLQKAEAHAREAQIEAALERVRSRTMGMQRSDELADASFLLDSQVRSLGIQTRGCAFNIYDAKESTEWFSSEAGTMPTYKTPRENIFLRYYEAGQSGKIMHIEEFEGETCINHYDYLCTLPVMGDALKKMKESGGSFPLRQIDHVIYFKYGYLLFITLEHVPEAHDIFKRFAKVFEQTYTRFLDLQKAEAQAREAQIEAALERLRARSMGMRKSEELIEVVRLLDKEIKGLGVQVNGSQIVTDFANPEDGLNDWFATEGQDYLEKFHIPYLEHPLNKRVYSALHKGVDFYTENYSKAEKNKYFRLLFKYSDFRNTPKERQEFVYNSPAWIRAVVVSKNSILIFQRYDFKEFTKEEEGIFKRFGKVFEQAYTRFLDLQKAEAQAREAQIEAALERVRSRTMGMQKSEELAEVIAQINAEITNLGIRSDNTGLITDIKLNEKSGSYCTWFSIPGKTYSNKFLIPRMQHRNRLFEKMEEAYQKKIEFFTISFTKEEKDRYLNFVFAESDLKSIPESRKEFLLNAPGWSQSVVLHKNSGLALQRFSNEEFSEEENAVAIRFGHVFEQTYTRFLDLQKAEAQAREAQVEAALERVRAASMAMHKSDELQEVISVVLNQMISLGIKTDVSYIVINAENTKDFNLWLATENNDYARQINLPYFKHPIHDDGLKVKKKQVGLGTHSYSKEEKNRYFEYQFKHSDLKYSPEERKKFILDAPGYTRSMAINKHTSIAVNRYVTTQFSTEENEILIRIAKVFEQAYTRFLDIKKAEAQAREAQIEAALERVRAKAMSMQNSEDLNATIGAFYRELEQFSITPRRCGVGLLQKNRLAELSTMNTMEKGNSIEIIGKLKMEGHWVLDGVYENWILQKEFHPVLRGNEIKKYNQLLRPQIAFPEYPNDSAQFGYFFFFPEGGVYAWTKKEMKEDELKIYRRFTTVLSLTYKRYKDLKDAEANALEAVRRASLDRVRAEIASMRTVDDLQRITPIIWHELTVLGVPFVRCGVFIMNEETGQIQVYLSAPDGHSLAALDLSFQSSKLAINTVDHWRQGIIFKTHWNRQEFINWMKSMIELGQVSNRETYQGAAQPPESLHLHFVPFKQGMLYVGNSSSLDKEALELVKALAESFSIAFARYEDFKQLETAKNQIEKTFTELKAAQAQLIQAEKMASLGELTAGIAHEIQNPLNFVNNFSELSNELIEEMKEELAVGNVQFANEIAGDILQNLQKINHHGKRAADIVKGMLLHSRTSNGQKEPTDINALCDEYLRLSYHGLRAKDKSFNADFKTEFDKTLPKINVIPQDIGRVLLNLINNAFYAVSEKSKLQASSDKPQVIVSTKQVNNKIEIRVQDNGSGIPAEIMDKIFQPFFTTKPTGQGTGLGLSLSYDIVKAHGGELKIESKEGEGTEFIIQIPLN